MANSNSGDSVVDRILRLIAAFPEGVTALQLSELAARAELPLTTAHRLVRQLAGHGLLDVGPGGSVSLGLRLWELANRNSPTLELRQAALPFMEDIQQVLQPKREPRRAGRAGSALCGAAVPPRLGRQPGAGGRPDAGARVLRRAGAHGQPAPPRPGRVPRRDSAIRPAGWPWRTSAPSWAKPPIRAMRSWPASWTRTRGGSPFPYWTAGSTRWRPSASSFPFARCACRRSFPPCRPRPAGSGGGSASPARASTFHSAESM